MIKKTDCKKISILDMRVDNYTVRESLLRLDTFLGSTMLNVIETVTMEQLILAAEHPVIKECLEQADLCIVGECEILSETGNASAQRMKEIRELVRNAELTKTQKVIADMSGDNTRQGILKGGLGGAGNQHFATSTMQVPKYARPGQPAQELEVLLELKVIADVGLVGFPNVGKSTLLSRVTNAQPKIANYHFTTLNPNLGVVDMDGGGFVIADIPGLIEGASEGVGLGHEFLRHIERTRVIIHLVDAASTEGRDPVADVYAINQELKAYNEEIAARPQIIAANKIDAIYDGGGDNPVERLKKEFEPQGIRVLPISAAAGTGLQELLYYTRELLNGTEQEPIVFEQEFFPEEMNMDVQLPYTVEKSAEEEGVFIVEGPRIEKMLGYTNLDSEKGFVFFQNFLKDTGILKELEEAGIQEGDTVRMYGLAFEYFR